jgi:hypothetical protein
LSPEFWLSGWNTASRADGVDVKPVKEWDLEDSLAIWVVHKRAWSGDAIDKAVADGIIETDFKVNLNRSSINTVLSMTFEEMAN